jgi:hypothetical protein
MSSLLPAPTPGDKRARLSLAEELLSIPYLSQRSVMSYLRQDEAVALRAASRACRDAVAEHAWEDFGEERYYPLSSRIRGSLAAWRCCFPNARGTSHHPVGTWQAGREGGLGACFQRTPLSRLRREKVPGPRGVAIRPFCARHNSHASP